jgi:anti-sigma factor RsiW
MHAVVMDSLENYLSGTIGPAQRKQVDAHLGDCGACREAVNGMLEVSDLLGYLRSDEVIEPSAGFLAGVMQMAGERKATARSFASLFLPDLVFARRLVFASLLMLGVLGGYLVSRESGTAEGMSPGTLLAQQDSPSFDTAPAPDNMLVTLTAYDRH